MALDKAGFIAGLSAFELGESLSAIKYFLYATLHSPRAAHMLVKSVEHFETPITSHQIEDHNAGIYQVRDLQGYIQSRGSSANQFFLQILAHPTVVALLDEIESLDERWHIQRKDRDHKDIERLQDLRSWESAIEHAKALSIDL